MTTGPRSLREWLAECRALPAGEWPSVYDSRSGAHYTAVGVELGAPGADERPVVGYWLASGGYLECRD